jgi:hypothetical protein
MSKTLTKEILQRELAVRDNIEEYSELFDVDPNLVRAVITQESKFVGDAKSPTGAFGYGQMTRIGADQVRLIADMNPFAKDLKDFTKEQASDPERGIKAVCATLWWLFYVKYKGVPDRKVQIEAALTFYNSGGRPAALVVKKGGHTNALSEIKALPINQRSQAAVYAPEALDWFVSWHEELKEKPAPAPVADSHPFSEVGGEGIYGALVQSLLLLAKLDPTVKVVRQHGNGTTELRITLHGKY